MSERSRDYAYEALAEATDAHMDANRGELNIALKSIREQTAIEDGYLLAAEIHDQAARYRALMGSEVMLTPTALAKHWIRVKAEAERPRGTNLTPHHADECPTCGGDRFVLAGTRPARQTPWMAQHGLEVVGDASYEEYVPCPECNDVRVTMRRFDGAVVTTPDASWTRERLRR